MALLKCLSKWFTFKTEIHHFKKYSSNNRAVKVCEEDAVSETLAVIYTAQKYKHMQCKMLFFKCAGCVQHVFGF